MKANTDMENDHNPPFYLFPISHIKSGRVRYCSADNIYCSIGAFAFYATTGSTLYLQAVLAITRYNFVCSKYR